MASLLLLGTVTSSSSKLPQAQALLLTNRKPPLRINCCSASEIENEYHHHHHHHHHQQEPISLETTTTNGRFGGAESDRISLKKCLRCYTLYHPLRNSPTSCFFHGHVTGEKGLFALAPPHQGIDGEWTDRSGVIVYKWNEMNDRPNTGSANWKKRWSCCSEYDENAPPCQRGWHVSYDDGFTLY